MNQAMKLLLCEFITAGGYAGHAVPGDLAAEGELMLQALLRDFSDCAAAFAIQELIVLRDTRLPSASRPGDSVTVTVTPVSDNFTAQFAVACAQADAVLLVAPETDGCLLRLTQQVQTAGKQSLGSTAAAVSIAASKSQTSALLQQHGITVVPCWREPGAIKHETLAQTSQWIVKPDDGVGGEGCRLLSTLPTTLAAGEILQPYIAGEPASLTLLCHNDTAAVWSANRQESIFDASDYRMKAIGVNDLEYSHDVLQQLADDIAAALPGLTGWVGVDLVITRRGPCVLEVNPRPTTAYAGLRESVGQNPAAALLTLLQEQKMLAPEHRQPVWVTL
ncbi:MAG: ATP-grasp domain-containing protein [Gammaproteobacteria bacterium]